MAHKITAIRLTQNKNGMVISGLTQSPRGTKVMAKSVKIPKPSTDRQKRAAEIQSAIEELLEREE